MRSSVDDTITYETIHGIPALQRRWGVWPVPTKGARVIHKPTGNTGLFLGPLSPLAETTAVVKWDDSSRSTIPMDDMWEIIEEDTEKRLSE